MFKIFDFKKGKEMDNVNDKIKDLENKILEKRKELDRLDDNYKASYETINNEIKGFTKQLLKIKNEQKDKDRDSLQNAYNKYINAKKEYENLCKDYDNTYRDKNAEIVFDFSDLTKVLDELFEKYEK